MGPKITKKIEARLEFDQNGYSFSLEPTADNRLIFGDEQFHYLGSTRDDDPNWDIPIGQGHGESTLSLPLAPYIAGCLLPGKVYTYFEDLRKFTFEAVSSWTVYHVHDTSETAGTRRTCSIRDNERLRPDAGNIAAFLYRLKGEELDTYHLIVETVRLVAPFFHDFKLRPRKQNGDEFVLLEWEQQGSDYPFHPSQLSDGTLRFIALATALLQPNPPATVLIDEPELGLHPYALEVLANLILQAQERTQLIVSTQSSLLLNSFEPDQIVVVDREDGESHFKRLDAKQLGDWLEDYTLGELWQKNIYGGGPVHE